MLEYRYNNWDYVEITEIMSNSKSMFSFEKMFFRCWPKDFLAGVVIQTD